MRMDHAGGTVIAALALSLATGALADEGNAERGGKLAYTCMGCHGIENYKNAYPKYSVPKLAGQSAVYIAAALAEYKAGARSHPTMKGMASTLSTQDHADLAAWFQGRERARSDATPVGTAPAAAAPCTACHGQNGIGTLPENPTLAGQHADYLAQALNDYRHGKRQNPIMSTFASQLSPADIQAITAYFAQQQGLATPGH